MPLRMTHLRLQSYRHRWRFAYQGDGHTAIWRAGPVDRANAVREILEVEGYPSANIYKVAGRADTDPLFPEDRSSAPNRRVTITLIREAPPVPVGLQP